MMLPRQRSDELLAMCDIHVRIAVPARLQALEARLDLSASIRQSIAWAAARWRELVSKRTRHARLKNLGNLGAGEGIRTLDPNLGKVVLYP